MSEIHEESQRIDIWLWHARFFKTRSLASQVVSAGKIRITAQGQTRRVSKASTPVRPGDRLTLKRNGRIVDIEILGLGERRGPATEARELYREADMPEDFTSGMSRGRG